MRISDWSSDVCSSDLFQGAVAGHALDHYDDLHIEHILPDTPNKGYDKIWDAEATNAFLPYARSEEHTSELQSLMRISYAVFCLKKKINNELTQLLDTKYIYISKISDYLITISSTEDTSSTHMK